MGPITVFVAQNTLQAFEHLPFGEAVRQARRLYGAEPYLPERTYRQALLQGRILLKDLRETLLEEGVDEADAVAGCLGSRYELRLAMLRQPLWLGPDAEIRWFLDEADALFRFDAHAPAEARRRIVDSMREWMRRGGGGESASCDAAAAELARQASADLGQSPDPSASEALWEAFSRHFLWRVVEHGAAVLADPAEAPVGPARLAPWLRAAFGVDPDELTHPELIRFTAAFLDQGYARWPLPRREEGYLRAFAALYGELPLRDPWLAGLDAELQQFAADDWSPTASVERSLRLLGVREQDVPAFIEASLLALRGWAGMLWQMETNGSWTARPAPPGTLLEHLAVRLVLDRLAAQHVARDQLHGDGDLSMLAARLRAGGVAADGARRMQRAMLVFQLAQLRGWTPRELLGLDAGGWRQLVAEIEAFDAWERRRTYQLAYERRFRQQTLDALAAFAERTPGRAAQRRRRHATAYQAVFCIDDREESLRRHLEETDPRAETFGMAGFFGVAMYYRGVADALYRPLCPVIIRPRHYVAEEAVYSLLGASRRQALARRHVGQWSHRLHLQTRTALGGMVTGLFGSLASIPLIMRILFPRAASRLGSFAEHIVQPPLTQLRLERLESEPGPREDHVGYTVDEMATIVGNGLRLTGLMGDLSPLVLIVGHASVSANNPHEAAYDCGACGGGPGGPNARAFAQMANDHRVRRVLAQRGLAIPEETHFVGCVHNTCDDSIEYFDVERIPANRRKLFERARDALDAARRRDAHERCRRFHSAPLSLTLDAALRHVENRSQDLSQVRPEYTHATTAMCVVGRRDRTRGLFLDRRAFLASYDPTQDDAEATVLATLLGAVMPVCSGIALQYYFSAVDPPGYGCGSKLPHNLASLLGVMEGAQSDLRTGLSAQMTEIHEPMRLLFVVETTPSGMQAVIAGNETIRQLVANDWVQLALLDPDGSGLKVYRAGQFEDYWPATRDLPVAATSASWYRGSRDNLGYAEICSGTVPDSQESSGGPR